MDGLVVRIPRFVAKIHLSVVGLRVAFTDLPLVVWIRALVSESRRGPTNTAL
jgi:hypothetical protein